MNSLCVVMLWAIAGAMCAVLVRFWAGAWGFEASRWTRVAITISGGVAAALALCLPSAVEDGWAAVLSRPGDIVARVSVLVAVALLSWSRLADPSRGRRRCPTCWYDMAGTPGLVCAECGRDAGNEARLYLARPRRRVAILAVAPLAVGAGIAAASLTRDPGWSRRIPDAALVLASFRATPGTTLTQQLLARAPGFDAPERALQRAVSHAVIARTQDSDCILIHARVLASLEVMDAALAARLIALTKDPSVAVRIEATRLLVGAGSESPALQTTLLALLTDRALEVRDIAAAGLILRVREPTEEARTAIFGAINQRYEPPLSMVLAASRLFPDDPRTAPLVAWSARRVISWDVGDGEFIDELIAGDKAARMPDGTLSALRRKLYTDDMILRTLYGRVLESKRVDWITWYVSHSELRDDVLVTMLSTLQYRREFAPVVLAQAARLGPRAETLRDFVVQATNDPVHADAARAALEAMGPKPASTIPR